MLIYMVDNKKVSCPECKTENPYYAKFCAECGTNLEFIENNGSNEIDDEQDQENIFYDSDIWNYGKHEKAIILGWLPFLYAFPVFFNPVIEFIIGLYLIIQNNVRAKINGKSIIFLTLILIGEILIFMLFFIFLTVITGF